MKAVLFDVDGLLIKARTKFFSERLAEEHGIELPDVMEFFQGNFKKCSFGSCDLKEELVPYVAKWGWKGSIEDLLTYWFTSESETDPEVIQTVDDLRSTGVAAYIATRQEKYRLAYLLDTVGLRKHVDGAFCTCDIGYDKKDREYYDYILEKLQLPAEEVMFFDDTPANVACAREVGIDAHVYKDVTDLRLKLGL